MKSGLMMLLILGILPSLASGSSLFLTASIYSGGKAADYLSSEYALHRGAVELNPLGQSRASRLALSIGITMSLTAGDVWLQKRSRVLPWILRIGVTVVHGGLVVRNFRNGAKR